MKRDGPGLFVAPVKFAREIWQSGLAYQNKGQGETRLPSRIALNKYITSSPFEDLSMFFEFVNMLMRHCPSKKISMLISNPHSNPHMSYSFRIGEAS